MLNKTASLRLKFGILLGTILLIIQPASPLFAQTGNQSDGTGPIPSTSDIAGGAFSTTGSGTETVFANAGAQTAVNQVATSLISELNANSLTGASVSPEVQQTLLNILTASNSTQAGASLNAFTSALANAPGAPSIGVIQELASKLLGLLAEGKVKPEQLKSAIISFNNMILNSNAEFLTNPPAELIAIRVSLSRLIAAIDS
jgi:hypothetical protein